MTTVLTTSAIGRIKTVRSFTQNFLSDLAHDEWFWMPSEGVTHIAWQVGHIAFAQYVLCLKRLRGERPADAELIAPDFIERYGRGSTPADGESSNLSVKEILAVLDRVFEQTLSELSELTDELLSVRSEPAHPMFETKLAAVCWSAEHEAMHAGQIILLRRMMGKPPKR